MSNIQVAAFRTDVTPPVGHPLCAGWVSPAVGIADALYAGGIILTGDGLTGDEAPVVLLAIDWCEISNRSYRAWQEALAAAAGTSPDRVTVHCMHAHCTPWPDEHAQGLVAARQGIPPTMDAAWCTDAITRVAEAARSAMTRLQPATHIGTGRARVERVASNRRIFGPDGNVRAVRWTRTHDPAVRAEPEGQIDPSLKTISFWNEDRKLAVLHYYAVHPSSYEDCRVTPDFTGIARERRMQEDGGVPHFYFTECAGDITAGKYNDGAHELREVFTDRIHQAMAAAEANATKSPLTRWRWQTVPIHLQPRPDHSAADLQQLLDDDGAEPKRRIRAALALAYHERAQLPLDIPALHLNDDVCIVHLPGESFMEFQHFAQAQRPDAFVAVPSYADCGPGYICLERSFAEGGYEPTDSFVAGASETVLKEAIARVAQRPE